MSPIPADLPPLLTTEELARLLRCKPAAVRQIAARGRIGYQRIERALRFRRGDVERFLDGNYVPEKPGA